MQRFSEKHTRLFSRFLEDNYGIYYSQNKSDMLQVKIQKLMKRNNITSYDEYYELVTDKYSQNYLTQFLDELSTHTTNFFRESSHFDFISGNVHNIINNNQRIRANKEIRVWSAACSSGEEAFTLSMVLKECLPKDVQIKILATDVSKKILELAIKGVYNIDIEKDIPKSYLRKYFFKTDEMYQVTDEMKETVTFRLFNLMEPFSFNKGFDIIFCRNVMIYFEAFVQEKLIQKFYDTLVPGGLLFIGHSEGSANRGTQFKYVQPTVYLK